MTVPHRCALWAFLGCLSLTPAVLHAEPEPTASPTPAPADAPKGFFERDSPLPDPGGVRAKLADKGITLGLIYLHG